jgi:hypothetical protein
MQATGEVVGASVLREHTRQLMTTAELGLLIGSAQMPEWGHRESCCRLSRLTADVLDSIVS